MVKKREFVNFCNNFDKNSQFLPLGNFNKIQSEGKRLKEGR